jgi:hypothetical protein
VKRLIVSVIVSICFLKQKRPDLQIAFLTDLFAMDEIRLDLAHIVFSNRDEIVNYYVLPDILLENLHQIYSKIIHLE